AGGITCIADMPLNCHPVTTSADSLRLKLDVLKGKFSEEDRAKSKLQGEPPEPDGEEKLWVDCAFYGGVIPGNSEELEPMIKMGVAGFKCFLVHSGIDEFPNVTEEDLRKAMPILARHNIPLLVHAELECGHAAHDADWKDPQSYKSFLESRPRHWENEAIEMMIRLCREFKGPVHIVHLSSSDALTAISQMKKDGLPFTVETCPHYLTFEAEQIPDGDPRFKCAPPIREAENREKLWRGLTAGLIDIVVSDHSPCVPDKKFISEGDLKKAWGGISSLQFGLPVIWTEAKKRGQKLEDLVEWMSARPAKFLGIANRKGAIKVGHDADLIAFDPDADFTINTNIIQHKNKVTPYEGRELKGVVRKTFVRGRLIYEDGKLTANANGDQILHNRVEIKA
ncbi:MAG: allantoinase AllB, partial [Candidatus Obscuribacterales bacterium]|nr:allantoinase AllB [Candidatus Obscuribacterales bacterium]